MPYRYSAKDFYNAVQWAIGLELFLLIEDPWRVFFTTDHPNGAPFTTYPEIFALLMDRDVPREAIATAAEGGARHDHARLDRRANTRSPRSPS